VRSFGSRELGEALLRLLPPADDSHIAGPVEAILEELTDDSGLVLRYRRGDVDDVDGLGGGEGAFLS
jgi:GH15 family glucan-1,4-alpha-glucosidase